MKMKFRNLSLFVGVILVSILNQGCDTNLKSTQKFKSSYAIVVDSISLQKIETAIYSYKNMLEGEGLKVYLVSDNWDNPSEIREILKSYYNSKPKLEGAVFIGDVPIPHVMNAQHLTTAYKRNQSRYPLHIAAIPTDRYYDDFDLKFDFIEKDSVRINNYYYSLSVDSPQYVKSDIYSGRIKPSIFEGEDKYKLMEDYLNKVVSLRNKNKLDFLMSFTGHGYNSEALTAWTGEKIALREQFPELYTPNGRTEFLNFDMDEFMKPYLLGRLQDPRLDVALLHEHGGPDMQLISGTQKVSSPAMSIANVKRYLRGKLGNAADRGRDLGSTKLHYQQSLGVPESWFEGSFDKEVMAQDSVYNYNLDIYCEDVHEISPEAKFIMFDACFNASFQKDNYLAGEYVFGKGSTMVVHGNSVNALQDKWPDEMIGLLGSGVRVGNWAKEINTLETHLIGDPSYYFSADQDFDYNKLFVAGSENKAVWEKLMSSENPDLQCVAMKNLSYPYNMNFSKELKDIYLSSSSFVVRMEALKLLYSYNDENLRDVLVIALSDPYELIRRSAATMVGKCGDDELISPLLNVIFDDKYSKRVKANAYNSFDFMNPDIVIPALSEVAQNYSYVLNSSVLRDKMLKRAIRNKEKVRNNFNDMVSDTVLMRYRMREAQTLRNYYYHFMVKDYCEFMLLPELDDNLRITMIEAMAWYNHSYEKEIIEKACTQIKENETFSSEIRLEAQRTLNRLSVKN